MIRLLSSKFCNNCKFIKGVGGDVATCWAFPKGIPKKIAYGTNDHSKPLPDQDNEIVFEERPK